MLLHQMQTAMKEFQEEEVINYKDKDKYFSSDKEVCDGPFFSGSKVL
jgi:hypothetical protein